MKYMKYKGIIFDLDGTLLDTLTDLYNAVNYTLVKLNQLPRTINEVRDFIGSGVATLLKRSLQDKTLVDEALEIFSPYYDQNKEVFTKPYDGILELLEFLNKTELKLGIVSNKVDEAVLALNDTKFRGILTFSFGARENLALKPDRALIDLCLAEMQLTASEVLYIGDTEIDYETAVNANLDFVAVTWGFRDRDFLEKLNPKFLIERPNELLELIFGLEHESN